MSQYHPDADPNFVAMTSHYEQAGNSLMNALFESASEINPLIPPLDSEILELCYHLWRGGFKIVPVASAACSNYTVFDPNADDFRTGTND